MVNRTALAVRPAVPAAPKSATPEAVKPEAASAPADGFDAASRPVLPRPQTRALPPSRALGYSETPVAPKPAASTTVNVASSGATAIETHGSASATLHVDQDLSLSGLSATVDLQHKWVSGLTVTVTSPSGKTATLPLKKGHEEQGTFDLSQAFAGEPAKGDWKLTVNDTLKTDKGQVNSWSLSLTGTPNGGGGGTDPGTGPIDPKDIPAADWTCFVNLNADNSLESFGEDDLNEMESVGSLAGKMNVIALVDGGSDSGNGWTTGTRLMYVTRDPNDSTKVVSREIKVDPGSDLGQLLAKGKGELDTGSPEAIHAAIDYVQKNVSSQHFMVDFWDHGNDWRGLSYDDHPSDNLDMPGLEKALSGLSQKIDIVSADACLMSTVEVADTVKAAGVDWLVGSEEVEPGAGWNYHDFLTRVGDLFKGKSDVSSAEIAHAIVDSYAAGGSENSTMAATDLSKLDGLNAQIDAFSRAVLAAGGLKDQTIRTAYSDASRFDDHDQMDLGDFATKLASNTKDAKLKAACDALLAAISQGSTEKTGDPNSRYTDDTGLTIYAPESSVDGAYQEKGVAWANSAWNQVIAGYSLARA